MKPRKILTESVRAAMVSFGQMLLQEGAVWAARRVERQRAGTGRRRARILSNPAIVPLISEGARFLETQWNQWLASRSTSRGAPGSRRRSSAAHNGAASDATPRRKARRKK